MKISYLSTKTCALILAFSLVTSCTGQSSLDAENKSTKSTSEKAKAEKIDDLLRFYSKNAGFNGSVLVAHQNELVYKNGFGMANWEWDIPNDQDTKFRVASITKQFTAMLILQLASENKLDLHTPISNYLPDYPKKNAEQITIHQLLNHSSGTPETDEFIRFRDMERNRYKPEDIMKIFSDGELEFTPGSKFKYSNSGYIILGVIIEKITRKSYEKVLQENIFEPLEMNNSGYDHNTSLLKNRASGYRSLFGKHKYLNANYIDMTVPYSAGSIYSTVEDLFLWDQALYTEKLLPKTYRDLLFEKYIPARDRHYGYGWFIGEIPIGKSGDNISGMHHGGGINGFNTRITRIPSDGSLIVLLNNTSRAPLLELTVAIVGILNDKPFDLPKKSVALALLDIIDKDGMDKGIQFFNEIKDDKSYYVKEQEMNNASYELLQSNKEEHAAEVLKLGISYFPNAFNLYDSYGEVLLKLGRENEAVDNYKKSVELNPNNKNGIRVLKELGIEIK